MTGSSSHRAPGPEDDHHLVARSGQEVDALDASLREIRDEAQHRVPVAGADQAVQDGRDVVSGQV